MAKGNRKLCSGWPAAAAPWILSQEQTEVCLPRGLESVCVQSEALSRPSSHAKGTRLAVNAASRYGLPPSAGPARPTWHGQSLQTDAPAIEPASASSVWLRPTCPVRPPGCGGSTACGPGGRAWRGALRVPSQAVPRSLREPAGNMAPAFDDEEEPQETRDQPCLSTRRPRALLSPADLLSCPVGGGCPHLSPHPGLEWLWRTVGGGESSCSRRTLWPRQAGWGRVAGCTRRGCIFLSRECGSLGEEGGGTRSQTHHHLEQQLFWAPSCRARAGVPGARKRRSFRGRSGGGAGPAPRTGGLGGEGRRQRHQPRHPEPRAP